MKNLFIITLFLIMGFSCNKNNEEFIVEENYQCKTENILQYKSQNEITNLFDDYIIKNLASSNIPDLNGALSNNKNGYFSVRFQIGMSNLADYTIDIQNTTNLEMLVKSIEYSFQYQQTNGDFQIIIPPNSNFPTPTEGDIASGNAFFLSSLGLSLLALEESTFYNSIINLNFKTRIENLRPQIQNSLNWLKTKQQILENYDLNAPNRLFFDAVAFYSLGKWLNDSNSKSIGINFAQIGISKKTNNGYFIENNGWDISYQGVALAVGFKLLSILSPDETIKQSLWECLSCGTNWQKSRILTTGEISTQKNTRVFSGGEQFLGVQKTVAWKSTIIAFLNMKYLSGNSEYETLSDRIITFYQ